MGVDSQEQLAQRLGHVKVRNIQMPNFGEAEAKLKSTEEAEKEARALKSMAVTKVSEHFSNMRKAFHYVDVDNNGTINAEEIRRAMHMWGMNLDDEKLAMLMAQCDTNGDGEIEYDEFVDHLARDTVAPAAMGKRGMQSLEAMGIDAQAHLAHELGHGKINNFKMPGYKQ